jgi:hypothetical protein
MIHDDGCFGTGDAFSSAFNDHGIDDGLHSGAEAPNLVPGIGPESAWEQIGLGQTFQAIQQAVNPDIPASPEVVPAAVQGTLGMINGMFGRLHEYNDLLDKAANGDQSAAEQAARQLHSFQSQAHQMGSMVEGMNAQDHVYQSVGNWEQHLSDCNNAQAEKALIEPDANAAQRYLDEAGTGIKLP